MRKSISNNNYANDSQLRLTKIHLRDPCKMHLFFATAYLVMQNQSPNISCLCSSCDPEQVFPIWSGRSQSHPSSDNCHGVARIGAKTTQNVSKICDRLIVVVRVAIFVWRNVYLQIIKQILNQIAPCKTVLKQTTRTLNLMYI